MSTTALATRGLCLFSSSSRVSSAILRTHVVQSQQERGKSQRGCAQGITCQVSHRGETSIPEHTYPPVHARNAKIR
jgi:hypothetical protein